MKILFYDTKKYDKDSFDKVLPQYEDIQVEYIEPDISVQTAKYAKGFEAVCGFVSSDLSKDVIKELHKAGVKLILMRCAGYNNVDLKECRKCDITVLRVPGYSPEAVAEHAMALALACNRRIHKAYIKVRENNFSLTGLTGLNFHGKTAGIIGTGKIGAAMCRICHGFGMKVIAYDIYKNPDLDFVDYTELDELLEKSDLISLHCPLTDDSYHMINSKTIKKMKDNVMLVNTSRGAIVDTPALIEALKEGKFGGVGLDVYEEEDEYFFEDRSNEIISNDELSRLLTFPNVLITSHQAFFTTEAMKAIAETTLKNLEDSINGTMDPKNTLAKRK